MLSSPIPRLSSILFLADIFIFNYHTKLVFIANPNNPTGTYIKEQELTDFLRSIPEDVLGVLDEAYLEYVTAEGSPGPFDKKTPSLFKIFQLGN